MNLRKLPPSMLVVLGLACSRTPPTVHPCLSQPYDPNPEDTGPCLSPPPDPDPGDVGPCLSPEPDPGDNDVGPCLEVPVDADVEPCLSPPEMQAAVAPDSHELPATSGVASTQHDALARVLARATLPPDVAERLRRRNGALD